MRELTRSNDPVFLSFLQSELKAEGIDYLLLDGFASSVMAPMNATAEQRIVVEAKDYWPAWTILAEAEEFVTEDELLGGRIKILQPKDGFRAAIDPIFLAASIPVENGDSVLDVGAGTGAAALALITRAPWAWASCIDVQPELTALCARSATRSGIAERIGVLAWDIMKKPTPIDTQTYDHVMSNPPYMKADTGQKPKTRAKLLASVETTATLEQWTAFMLDRLKEGGTFSMVHRADRLDEILSLIDGPLGELKIIDLQTKDDGRPTKRVIVQGTKGGTTTEPARRQIIVHEDDGTYSAEGHDILRGAKALSMP